MDELKDKLAEWFRRDLDELRKNKTRTILLVVCIFGLLIYSWEPEATNVEEIDLGNAPPATKDLPVQKLPDKKIPETSDGVKIVLGASNEELFVGDPFASPPKPEPPKKVDLPQIPSPQPIQQPQPQPTAPKEKIILTGTAISGTNKTAMFLHGKQTIFLSVGEEIGGRIISDITPDFVTFADGTRLYLQKELN